MRLNSLITWQLVTVDEFISHMYLYLTCKTKTEFAPGHCPRKTEQVQTPQVWTSTKLLPTDNQQLIALTEEKNICDTNPAKISRSYIQWLSHMIYIPEVKWFLHTSVVHISSTLKHSFTAFRLLRERRESCSSFIFNKKQDSSPPAKSHSNRGVQEFFTQRPVTMSLTLASITVLFSGTRLELSPYFNTS